MPRIKDLTGQRFGRLACLKDVGRTRGYNVLWLCVCDCGNQTIVASGSLQDGSTKSCGCFQKDRASECHRTHGLYHDENGRRSKLSRVWSTMKERCSNPNCASYADYGGRGIKVCGAWQAFENFHKWAHESGYHEGLTIDREDVEGNYDPSNCLWIPKSDQSKNRRNALILEFAGRKMKLTEWATSMGVSSEILRNRLRKGWSINRTLGQPIRRHANRCDY